MNFLPINLGVRQSSDAEKGASKDRSQLKSQTEKTLQRDDYTCRFCGFHSRLYQRVVPWSDGKDEFVTACTFCEQCLALERAGMMGSGVLVWLPEMAQAELNHVARAIYITRSSEGPLAEAGQRAFDTLMARRADAKKRVGSDDPLLLATVMHESLTAKEMQQAAVKLEGVRLMPLDRYVVRGRNGDVNQFPQMIKYWCSPEGPYAAFPAEKWGDIFKTAMAATGHA